MNRASSGVVPCLAFLLGGSIGLMLPSIRGGRDAAAPLDPDPDSGGDLIALAAMVEKLEVLHGTLQMERPPRASRTPVMGQELPQVLNELRELVSSLNGLKFQHLSPPLQLSELATMEPSRGVRLLFAPYADLMSGNLEWSQHNDGDLDRKHFLWSAQDLVRTYGPPTRVSGEDDVLIFIYGAPESEWTIGFRIREGVVYDATLDN